MSDLISRDALKEDFKSRLAVCNEWIEKAKDKETKIRASAVKAFIGEVIMTIDNAPSVEPRIEYGTDGQPYRLFMSGGQVVPDTLQGWRYEERPQGEWIKNEGKDIRDNFYTCSKCGRTVNVLCGETLSDYPFCHCGADMRGAE